MRILVQKNCNNTYTIYNKKHINNNKSNEDVFVMRYVINQIRRKDLQNLLGVIRLEIDYELVTLQDALDAEDTVEIIKAKEKLYHLVQQFKELS